MDILVLSIYPIDKPLHGGQHRVYNIVKCYRDAGYFVQVAGVIGGSEYPGCNGFVKYPGADILAQYAENPVLEDFAIGELFYNNDYYFNSLAEIINPSPDLIHVEQPWLFQFARRYVAIRSAKPTKILYGSQNIENELKFGIMKTYFGKEAAESAQQKVLDCEMAAINAADAICCVSQHDIDWTQTYANAACVLAANGVRQRITTESGIKDANNISRCRKFALFCASAHPPNMAGFFEIFGEGVGCIAPDESIILVGGVGPAILADPRFTRTAVMSRACISAGTVSEDCLQGLLETAHSIILPITQGGGTNLKTAEALWSGKHIVATTIAMRGFEEFTSSNGIRIADKPSLFLSALRAAMSSPPNVLSESERETRKVVLWDNTLEPLLSLVSSI